MKAVVPVFNRSLNNYQARTDNEIAVSFAIDDGLSLKINEVLEVDLASLVETQTLRRANTGQLIRVRLRDIDIHDLRLSSWHGVSQIPSRERMSAA